MKNKLVIITNERFYIKEEENENRSVNTHKDKTRVKKKRGQVVYSRTTYYVRRKHYIKVSYNIIIIK